ncbi:7SK snRNA methylphosphate capping enzyme [Nothobranchius furzeri]|uniref:RNA methyltransferase n=1 Tax=Nothobranchius furzeri TaxID=105023 RepID=A0A1A7ZBN5_NOTFU|nr:transcript variant X3 [Nothobranchius furzeri]KAF7205793.1 transcript variant X2 [Nothobranchius furzeri]KAF7205794.1 transcript variant X1 [Nothobranchius furzeri]
MSVDEKIEKAGSPQASSASPLQLSECSGGYSSVSVTMEEAAATPDCTAACPVPGTAASPKHTSTDSAGQKTKGNDNGINRRNSFQHVKQQQQQQTKLTKRRYTASSGFKHPSSGKRRRRAVSESDSVLPTKFLLGGNIFDPLNLNSLMDEEVNRALNAETPKSSPLPAKSRDPVEILIPRDITDPLNLNSGIADSILLASPFKGSGRKRHRNRHHGGGAGSGISNNQTNASESEKGEVKSSTSAQLPGMPDSCSAQDASKEPNSFSSVPGDSREPTADNTASSVEEAASVAVENPALLSVGSNQPASRRKRRRNSGKMEHPVTHSTPVSKSGSGDGSCGTGGQKSTFHTPRSGPKVVLGPRQHQYHHSHTKEHQKKFQFGNYNKYYGYRNPGNGEDQRIFVLRQEWFEGKDVLDLGCNSGHLTLYIAKMFRPARILGLDIDSGLIRVARKNIRHYLSELQTQEARHAVQEKKTTTQEKNENECLAGTEKEHGENRKAAAGQGGPAGNSCLPVETGTQEQDSKTDEMEQKECDALPANTPVSCSFPVSLRISRGPIAAPPITETCTAQPGEFPSNVSFITANYVLQNDNLLLTQCPEYDVILCLSVTKWVHLNWGDSGLKRFFRRAYKHLRPGGMFILEPQPWESYVRRKKLSENISRNFHSIRLKPDQFSSYLTSEVGFTSFEHLGSPKCSVKGFQRPIYVFHK